ncbi:hypothetical protein LZ30DRAFT_246882 [Colletotrichum cereale]|nr:hypothetical protein LZ30DRAFT_246882 [Colletotrichum cereale]
MSKGPLQMERPISSALGCRRVLDCFANISQDVSSAVQQQLIREFVLAAFHGPIFNAAAAQRPVHTRGNVGEWPSQASARYGWGLDLSPQRQAVDPSKHHARRRRPGPPRWEHNHRFPWTQQKRTRSATVWLCRDSPPRQCCWKQRPVAAIQNASWASSGRIKLPLT